MIMWSDLLALPFLAECFFSVVLLNAMRGNPHKITCSISLPPFAWRLFKFFPALLFNTFFHIHRLKVLADPLEHEIMSLAFTGGPRWPLSLSPCQCYISAFICCGVKPHGARAYWLFPFHPATLMTSGPKMGKWKREVRQMEWCEQWE